MGEIIINSQQIRHATTSSNPTFNHPHLRMICKTTHRLSPSSSQQSNNTRNVLFAQKRVARLNLIRHAAATEICSRSSMGGGGFGGGGGGCGTLAEGRGLGSGSIASWLCSAERVRGALEA
jgi:hypothetical protein